MRINEMESIIAQRTILQSNLRELAREKCYIAYLDDGNDYMRDFKKTALQDLDDKIKIVEDEILAMNLKDY